MFLGQEVLPILKDMGNNATLWLRIWVHLLVAWVQILALEHANCMSLSTLLTFLCLSYKNVNIIFPMGLL